MMALIVETGSIVTGANTYVSRADYISYAAALGVTIADVVATDVQLITAANFLETYRPRFKGELSERDQPLAWPRENVYIENWYWTSSEIPRQVILAQQALALQVNAGDDLYNPPVNPQRATRRERVEGAVEVEYFGSDNAAKLSRDSEAMALVNCLLNNSGLQLMGTRV